ncbi:MAG: asparaginase [Deltaproteobacteria bacterium]|nr:asparaginase [Deltaproteobacteria bacterium]
MQRNPRPVAEVLRGGLVESVHRGSVAVVDREGRLRFFHGDPDFAAIMRSCAKPFQALPMVLSGAADRFGLTDREIAITTGSISGQDFQEETVRAILGKIGLDESSLQCGTHRPFHVPTAKRLDREGKKAGPLRNSCAGKHAGMLGTCVFNGWPLETYMELGHPLQQWVLERVSFFAGVPEERIPVSIDGCGLPTFQVPLRNLAWAFARLTGTEDPAVLRIMECARRYPEMIAGENRICTDLIRVSRGRVFGKVGGEAVYGISLFEKGWGVAIKIEDGSLRAMPPVVVETLAKLGVLGQEELNELEQYHHPRVTNHRGEIVGEVRPTFDLTKADGSQEKIAPQ